MAAVRLTEVTTSEKRLPQRIERKFYVLPKNVGVAYGLLRHTCRPDIEYPQEQINSLYFDTAALDQHTKSLSGDFRKDKVRIRWYHEAEPEGGMCPVFLELKTREGFASYKQRLRLLVPAQNLRLARLGDGIVPKTLLADTIAKFGYIPPEPLQPVIRICYWRYRFREILTGARVSLDCHIRSTIIARGLGYRGSEVELSGGVIEVKGRSMELPATLKHLKLLDIDWSRFSKYSTCIDSHQEEPGTVGYLSPSGKIIQL